MRISFEGLVVCSVSNTGGSRSLKRGAKWRAQSPWLGGQAGFAPVVRGQGAKPLEAKMFL